MVLLYALVVDERAYELLAVPILLLFCVGVLMLFSLRQAICCAVASLAMFLIVDLGMLVAVVGVDFGGRGGVGAAVAMLALLALSAPFALVAAWVAAYVFLKRRLEFAMKLRTRRLLGGAIMAVAVGAFGYAVQYMQ